MAAVVVVFVVVAVALGMFAEFEVEAVAACWALEMERAAWLVVASCWASAACPVVQLDLEASETDIVSEELGSLVEQAAWA